MTEQKSLDKKKEYINKKDIIKYKIPVDKNFLKMFKDDDIFEITKPESLDKKKTKELDWEEDFCRQVRFYCGVDLDYETELKPLIKTVYSLLQKQRTELLKLVNKAFEETVIESESCDYDFYEKLNNLLNKKDEN